MREYMVERDFEKESIKEYEKKILASGYCQAFLPVSFIMKDNTDMAVYDCSGYCRLEEIKELSAHELIKCIDEIFYAFFEASDHLINPERIEISRNTVYRNVLRGNYKLAFVPKTIKAFEGNARCAVMENVLDFIAELACCYQGKEELRLLEEVWKCVEENYSVSQIHNRLSDIKRDIAICGIS